MRDCHHSCVAADSVSTVNILGALLSDSGATHHPGGRHYNAGVVVTERSAATISRSLLRRHSCAVSVTDADLVLEENCVTDVTEDAVTEAGLQLELGAVYVSRAGNVVIRRNNFHNCGLGEVLLSTSSVRSLYYRVSHITGPALFLLFSRVLEHIHRNFS